MWAMTILLNFSFLLSPTYVNYARLGQETEMQIHPPLLLLLSFQHLLEAASVGEK